MIDQNMVTYAQKLFPAPNLTGNPQFNGLDTTKTITRQDEGSGRLDHQFGQHDSVWARYTSFRQPVTGSGGFAGLLHDQVTDGYNVAVDYTHLFSGSMLAEFHFGRTSVNIDQGSNFANAPPSFGTQVGFSPNFAGDFRGGVSMIPEVVIQGYIGNPNPSAHGAAQVDDTHVSNIWEYGGDFTKTVGRHTFKAGANFASNNANALYLNSSVQFAAANTANPLDLSGGNAIASFLLGDPNNASRRNVIETEHGGWVDGFYAMDQWKVTSKLNVNFGFRYDITFMPIYGDNANANNYVGDMDFRNGTYILARNAPSCAADKCGSMYTRWRAPRARGRNSSWRHCDIPHRLQRYPTANRYCLSTAAEPRYCGRVTADSLITGQRSRKPRKTTKAPGRAWTNSEPATLTRLPLAIRL